MDIQYNHRYPITDASVRQRLEQSMLEVEGMDAFTIKCPICGAILQEVYGVKAGYVKVKCHRCKFLGPLNLAYFRRQKKSHRYLNTRVPLGFRR